MVVYTGMGHGDSNTMCSAIAILTIILICFMFVTGVLDYAGKNKEADGLRITQMVLAAIAGMSSLYYLTRRY